MKQKLTLLALTLSLVTAFTPVRAELPSELNDLQIAHVAYIADNIDIRYAHLALGISENPAIIQFAETMIRDHNAVNGQALALLEKLGASPEDNFLSQSLLTDSKKIVTKLSHLHGAVFDKAYAKNELAYHKAVNDLVENSFIPNIENDEVKDLFIAGLKIFKTHEAHAEKVVSDL